MTPGGKTQCLLGTMWVLDEHSLSITVKSQLLFLGCVIHLLITLNGFISHLLEKNLIYAFFFLHWGKMHVKNQHTINSVFYRILSPEEGNTTFNFLLPINKHPCTAEKLNNLWLEKSSLSRNTIYGRRWGIHKDERHTTLSDLEFSW